MTRPNTDAPSKRPYPKPATSAITLVNRWDHFLARWGVKRFGHRVEPGLYALGSPSADSSVFVTANYTLSFDELRTALAGIDCYILVLDTKGVNVWCAAGKGTFGTDQLVHRVESTGLKHIVNHRVLILPQLGATGVAAHEVKKRSGFNVEYGPVCVHDLPEYLKTHKATPEMRRVHFGLRSRLILIPVELVSVLIPMVIAAVAMFFIAGPLSALGIVSAMLAGTVLFPILLPWIPSPNFSTKGFLLGGVIAFPFVLASFFSNPDMVLWRRASSALSYLLALPPVTAYLSLNFTGATTFTSKSGVKREIYTYIPVMAWMFGAGMVLSIVLIVIRVFGGA